MAHVETLGEPAMHRRSEEASTPERDRGATAIGDRVTTERDLGITGPGEQTPARFADSIERCGRDRGGRDDEEGALGASGTDVDATASSRRVSHPKLRDLGAQ